MSDHARRRLWITGALLVVLLIVGLVVRNQVKVYWNRQRRAEEAAAIARNARNRQALFDMLQPIALANCELERFGEAHDGG